MISGMFSIVYQGITTRILPMLKLKYTSHERQSQIYIGAANWFLLLAVLAVMALFQRSHNLAAAYGLAVTGTMTITGVMMTWIFTRRRRPIHAAVAAAIILVYRSGQKKLYQALRPLPMDVFLLSFEQLYRGLSKISGTALFFARDTLTAPPYMVHTIFKNNIIVSIVRRPDPDGITGFFKEPLAEELRVFEIQCGYLERVDVEEILQEAGIVEKVIFCGVEEIQTTNPFWHVFSFIKKNTMTVVRFYHLPPNKLHGVVTRVEL